MKKLRHLIAVRDLSHSEILDLFRQAHRLKSARGRPPKPLAGRTLGLLFYKPSLRTRLSFEVGMAQLGGQCLYIGPVELQGGQRESPKDLARVLSRTLDGIVARTFDHRHVVEMARESAIPVINGLSDFTHPCQALADLFTLQERLGRLKGVRLAFVGDGNNVCHALMEACALMGLHLVVATPAQHRPDPVTFRWAQERSHGAGGSLRWSTRPADAVQGAQAVYTDVWTSMGQEAQRQRRLRTFRGFQVNSALMRKATAGALFMHCLPAHRGEEVSDELMDSRRAIVYDQAENRLHVQKAILLKLLKGVGTTWHL